MIIAAHGGTYPDAGVMAARPATAPAAMPTPDGFFFRHHSKPIQASIAVDAPSCVFTSAYAATPPAELALPALKPNQPNQRMPAPRSTSGTLCGRSSCLVRLR